MKARAQALPRLIELTPDEIALLRSSPYTAPARVRGTRDIKIAQGLITRGLLERDPSLPGLVVRCTDDGEFRAAPLSATRARMYVQAARVKAEEGDPDDATAIEIALVSRVLAEIALVPDNAPRNGELARIALSAMGVAR